MSKKMETYMLVAVLLLAVGVGYFVYNGTQGAQQAALVNQAAPGAGSNQLPDCSDQLPRVQYLAYYYDPNNNNLYTKVATTAYMYIAGSPTASDQQTTTTTGIVLSGSGNLSCGATYREIVGDGSTYYFAKTADFVVNNAVVPPANNGLGIETPLSGAAVAYVKNSTGTYSSNVIQNWTAAGGSNGSTDSTNLMVKVQAPAAPYVFGDLGYAICFRYNSGNFSDFKVLGGTSVAIAHLKTTAALDTVQCTELPSLLGGEAKEYTVSAKAAATGPMLADSVDMVLIDKTNELHNGWLVPSENAAAGVSANGYDTINNVNTGTGRADVTYTTAFNFTR